MPPRHEPESAPGMEREAFVRAPETRVFLIRHGKTSEPDRFHGAESNVGLSERGVRQARLLAGHLASLQLVGVYSSPMSRALETAGPIAIACGLEIETVPAFHECGLGRLSGLSKEKGEADYVELTRRWAAGEVHFQHEAGESYAELRARIHQPFLELAQRHRGAAFAVVSHGLVVRCLLTSLVAGLALGDFERIQVRTGSFSELRWDGSQWIAEALNARPPSHS